jgi:hypothetical protein
MTKIYMKYARLPQVVYEQLSTLRLEQKEFGDTLKRIEALTSKDGKKVGYIIVESSVKDSVLGPGPGSPPTRYYFTTHLPNALEELNNQAPIKWEESA